VNVVVALLIDAVVNNEPVLTVTAEPVFTMIGNVVPSPLVNVIVFKFTEAVNTLFKANDAVIAFWACEALNAYEELVAVLALVANDELIAVVANDAVVANEAEVACTTLFIVKGNVVASPLVNVIVALLIDAVRTLFNANDAVVANDADTAEPVAIVTGNVEPSPLVNVIILPAAEAVVSNDAVDTVVPAFRANDAVVANDELTAFNTYEAVVAVSALEAVINKLPVIVVPKPVCSSLPLT
jgi:hypothetical protein